MLWISHLVSHWYHISGLEDDVSEDYVEAAVIINGKRLVGQALITLLQSVDIQKSYSQCSSAKNYGHKY